MEIGRTATKVPDQAARGFKDLGINGNGTGQAGTRGNPGEFGLWVPQPRAHRGGWEPRRPYLLRQQRQRFSRLGCGGGGRLLELILRLRARHGLIRVSAGSALPCDNHHPAGCGSAGADGTCTGLNGSREAQGGPRGRARGAAAAARSIPGGRHGRGAAGPEATRAGPRALRPPPAAPPAPHGPATGPHWLRRLRAARCDWLEGKREARPPAVIG